MKKLCAILLLLAFAACGSSEKPNDGFTIKGNETMLHAATGFIYPRTIDNFKVVSKVNYDSSGKHYSVGYTNNENFTAMTIYIYPPEVLAAREPGFDKRYEYELQEILKYHPSGVILKQDNFIYGKFSGKKAAFTMNEPFAASPNAVDLISELYLAQGENYMVKFRTTYLAADADENRMALDSFLAKWAAANSEVQY